VVHDVLCLHIVQINKKKIKVIKEKLRHYDHWIADTDSWQLKLYKKLYRCLNHLIYI
jgi:hypothetical protein